jgi:hypothetical protein
MAGLAETPLMTNEDLAEIENYQQAGSTGRVFVTGAARL